MDKDIDGRELSVGDPVLVVAGINCIGKRGRVKMLHGVVLVALEGRSDPQPFMSEWLRKEIA